jgi:hypothetical protein
MSRSGWVAVGVIAGAAILGLSFVDAWIVHHREVRGEGYREVITMVNAWRGPAVPVLSLGVVVAVAAAGMSLISSLGRPPTAARAWVPVIGAVVTAGLLGSVLVPIAQDGHASSIDLSPGWPAFAGVGLALVMVVAGLQGARPGARGALALAGLTVVVVGASAGGRWGALQAASAPTEAWAPGTYTRAATGEQEASTLTVEEGRFRIGDRWEGAWESHSWTVILTSDPACPDARGTYHAHNVGPDGEDLRFVKVVDTCADGARAADLETGTWERDP